MILDRFAFRRYKREKVPDAPVGSSDLAERIVACSKDGKKKGTNYFLLRDLDGFPRERATSEASHPGPERVCPARAVTAVTASQARGRLIA